jgi:ornithine cyclodeaminase
VQIVDTGTVAACLMPDSTRGRSDMGGGLHVKGAYLRGSSVLSFKVATGGFPGATPTGFSVVLDAAAGAPRWLLSDDGLLTEMRTAAAGALACATLARADVRRLLVIGSGSQARAQIHAHREALPQLTVVVWGRDRARAAELAADVGAVATADITAAVAPADIIVPATSSRAPLIHAKWVRPGTPARYEALSGASVPARAPAPPPESVIVPPPESAPVGSSSSRGTSESLIPAARQALP